MKNIVAIVSTFILFHAIPMVLASGISKPVQIGPKAVGMGGAFVGVADDPTAIFHNPAGMTQMTGHNIQLGMDSLITSEDYTCDPAACPGAGKESADNELLIVPQAFYVSNSFKPIAFGLGLYFPHGNGGKYSGANNNPANPTEGRIYSMEIAPAVAYQLLPSLSIGATLRMVYVTSTLKGQAVPALGDTINDLSVSGWGIGAAAGALYKPCKYFSLGANYRSKVSTDVSGDIAFATAPADKASYEQVLPTLVSGGVSVMPFENLTAAVSFDWERNSEIKPLNVKLATLFPAGLPFGSKWDDSYTIHFGLEYWLFPTLALRTGYAKDLNDSIPDTQMNRIIGDIAAHEVSVGGGYTWGRYNFGLAWNARFGERDIPIDGANNPAPGHYVGFIQSINLAAAVKL